MRTYRLHLGAAELWTELLAVDHYQSWWPSLRDFDADSLDVGEKWNCSLQPQVPFVPRLLRFAIEITAVETEAMIETTISGDVVGSARLDLAEVRDHEGTVSEIRLESALIPRSRALRFTAGISRRLASRGHAVVLDRAARQFAEHLEGSR